MKVYLATVDMNGEKAIFQNVDDAKAWIAEAILSSFDDEKPEIIFEKEEGEPIFVYVPQEGQDAEGMIEEFDLQ